MIFDIILDGTSHRVELAREGPGWRVRMDGRDVEVDAVTVEPDVLSLLIAGRSFEAHRQRLSEPGGNGGTVQVVIAGRARAVEVRDPRSLRNRRAASAAAAGPRKLAAPMPGKVVRVLAPAGTDVEAGQGVVVIEAMKMQNELKSPKKGRVLEVLAGEGAAVNAGDVLAVVE